MSHASLWEFQYEAVNREARKPITPNWGYKFDKLHKNLWTQQQVIFDIFQDFYITQDVYITQDFYISKDLRNSNDCYNSIFFYISQDL